MASKREKRDLLDEMEQVTGMHRKSLTRLLNTSDLRPKSPRRRPQRRSYGAEVEHVVGLVWEALDGIGIERLTAALRSTAEHLEQLGDLVLTDELRTQLEAISISTVQRILQRRPRLRARLSRAATERTIGKSKMRYKTRRGYKSLDGLCNGIALTQWLYSGSTNHDLGQVIAA